MRRRWEGRRGGATTVSADVRASGLGDRGPENGPSGRALRTRGDLRPDGAGEQGDDRGAAATHGGGGAAGDCDGGCEQYRPGDGWVPKRGENVTPCLFEQSTGKDGYDRQWSVGISTRFATTTLDFGQFVGTQDACGMIQ